MKLAMVVDTDDVSSNSIRHDHTVLRHESKCIRNLHFAVFANMQHFHARLVASRTNTEKRNTVAVARIHIGLDFENKSRKMILKWVYHANASITRLRARSPIDKRIEHIFNTKIVHTRTEEYRALFTSKELPKVKGIRRPLHKFDRLAHVGHFHRIKLIKLGIVEPFNQFAIFREAIFASGESHEMILQQ